MAIKQVTPNLEHPAKKYLYDSIQERLRVKAPGLKKFGRFCNQFKREKKQGEFDYPAAFMLFASMVYKSQATDVQVSECTFELHIGNTSIEEDNGEFFTVIDQVYKALQGFQDASGVFTSIYREMEEEEVTEDNVTIWKITFNTFLSDKSAERVKKLRLLPVEPDLEVIPQHDEHTKPYTNKI